MSSDDGKPSEREPAEKPRKPVRPWVAWVMAFFGVNPGYKPWEEKPDEPPAGDDNKPQT